MARRKGSYTQNIVGSGVAYKYAKKSLDKNKYGQREFIGPRIKWTVALNAINFDEQRFRRYAFKYFSVKNPPQLENKRDDVSRRGHTYKEVQDALRDSALSMEDWLFEQGLNNQIDSLYYYLEKQRQEAIRKEEEIYEKFVWPRLTEMGIKNIGYKDFVENTPVGEKPYFSLANSPLNFNDMTTIELWTRAAMNQLIPFTDKTYRNLSENKKNELAFYSFIKSKELYNALKMDERLSFFSRHYALEKDYAEEIEDKVNLESLEILDRALREHFEDEIKNDNLLGQLIDKAVFDTYTTVVGVKGGKTIRKIKENKINTSAEQASKTIRNKLGRYLAEMAKKNKEIDEKFTKVELSNEKDQVFFLVYADGFKPKTVLYQEKINYFVNRLHMTEAEFKELMQNPTKENAKLALEFIQHMFSVILEKIQNVNTTNNSLNLLGLGKLNLPENEKAFKNRAITYGKNLFSENKTLQIIKSKKMISAMWKSFDASNNNTFISGLLGEIGALNVGNIFENSDIKGLITGATYGSKNSFGQNVNDLQFRGKDSKYNIGVNVKHYVDSSGNTMILYPEGSISSSNDIISKYLEPEEKEILRFISANSGLFKLSTLEKEGYLIAYNHVPEFYRLQDRTRGSLTNVFFELNNVIYPLSYIYDNALAQLEELAENIKHARNKISALRGGKLFDVEVKNYKENLYQYHDVHEAFEQWEDDDFRLSTRKFPSGETTINIKTKGLKINLMSLKLFN